MVRLLSAIAARFGIVVSEEAAAKAIPIVGAASGSIINVLFINHFQDMARGHFIVRRLERKYGTDMVREEYLRMATPGGQNVSDWLQLLRHGVHLSLYEFRSVCPDGPGTGGQRLASGAGTACRRACARHAPHHG